MRILLKLWEKQSAVKSFMGIFGKILFKIQWKRLVLKLLHVCYPKFKFAGGKGTDSTTE